MSGLISGLIFAVLTLGAFGIMSLVDGRIRHYSYNEAIIKALRSQYEALRERRDALRTELIARTALVRELTHEKLSYFNQMGKANGIAHARELDLEVANKRIAELEQELAREGKFKDLCHRYEEFANKRLGKLDRATDLIADLKAQLAREKEQMKVDDLIGHDLAVQIKYEHCAMSVYSALITKMIMPSHGKITMELRSLGGWSQAGMLTKMGGFDGDGQ